MPFFTPDSSLVFDVVASPNHGERAGGRAADMIILHYTGMQDAQEALLRLCTESSGVSSHYVVMEDGRIIQCVPEDRRAWHAGESYWAGETDINSCSIGIEIVNPGHEFGYPDFPKRQIAAVIALCRGIVIRRNIPAHRVLAHSDVAPSRKMDPGEKFPWEALHRSRVGHWTKPVPILPGPDFSLGDRGEIIELFQQQLSAYGYFVPVHGQFDVTTQDAVMAFQRHFRTEQVDGVMDSSTIMTLNTLVNSIPEWTPAPVPSANLRAKDTPAPIAAVVAATALTAEDTLPQIDPMEFAAKLAAELASEFTLKDLPEEPAIEPDQVAALVEDSPLAGAMLAEIEAEFEKFEAELKADIEDREAEDEIEAALPEAASEYVEIELDIEDAAKPDSKVTNEAAPPALAAEAEAPPVEDDEDIIGELEPGTEVMVFEPKPKAPAPKS